MTGAGDEGALVAEAGPSESRLERAPLFLPYLTGERTPHNDPHAKGVFFSLDQATGRGDLGWAVLKGAAFAFADGYDALAEAGTGLDEISVLGGGARSALWGRFLPPRFADPSPGTREARSVPPSGRPASRASPRPANARTRSAPRHPSIAWSSRTTGSPFASNAGAPSIVSFAQKMRRFGHG